MLLVGLPIWAVIGLIIGLFYPDSLSIFDEDSSLLHYVFGFIAGMINYLCFEGNTGRTIGKFITKTKMIDEQGNKPTFSMIVVRSLCRPIPFKAFSFLGDAGKGWHDTFSKTRVVEA